VMREIALSVVVPVYNEEESIGLLYENIREVCDKLDKSYEIIFIDDGSEDGTLKVLKMIYDKDSRVKVIKFRKNYGQTAAMSAGFEYAKGEIIISLDGDLQNDPVDIPSLLKKIEEGYDIVCGWRIKRKDKLLSRRIPSKVANWIISILTGVKIHDNGCSLKAYRSNVIKIVPLYSEMHRFIPAMASMHGARITEMKVAHHPRKFGRAKYGISRIWRVFLDLITIKMLVGFSSKPALWFGVLSLPFAMMAIFFLVLSLFDHVFFSNAGSSYIIYPSVSFLLFFLVFQLNACGIISEHVLRTGNPEQIHTEVEIE
jgi:glycosyltransferase involved in cell wall biosynthesis